MHGTECSCRYLEVHDCNEDQKTFNSDIVDRLHLQEAESIPIEQA